MLSVGLKWDKKARMTNQSSGIACWTLGKIWELGDYDDSNWTKAARAFGLGRWHDERATISYTTLRDEWSRTKHFRTALDMGCSRDPKLFDLIDGRFSSLQYGRWTESTVKARTGDTRRKHKKPVKSVWLPPLRHEEKRCSYGHWNVSILIQQNRTAIIHRLLNQLIDAFHHPWVRESWNKTWQEIWQSCYYLKNCFEVNSLIT